MNFAIAPEMQKILAEIQQFVEGEIYPLEQEVSAHGFRATLPKLRAARQKVKEKGFWCPQIPKEYGGMGLGLLEQGLGTSVLGSSLLGHYVCHGQAPEVGNMEILIRKRTPEQERTCLEP